MDTRSLLTVLLATLCVLQMTAAPGHAQNEGGTAPGAPADQPFDFDDVKALAKERAAKPYHAPDLGLHPALAALDWGQHSKIAFKRERGVWGDRPTPFRAFYHLRSGLHRHAINLYEVIDGKAHAAPFDLGMFDWAGLLDHATFGSENPRVAGFRLLFPMHEPGRWAECVSVLGGTYFRAVGQHQTYGTSARGVAIDAGFDHQEEFPDFTDFWLVAPPPPEAPGGDTVTVWALMDGPSLTGAFRFVLKPGEVTTIDTDAHFFLRRPVRKLGIAPLTSMFVYGEGSSFGRGEDYRPEVHDADGLIIHNGPAPGAPDGEWLWRPLTNQHFLRVNRFILDNPKGFGLLQRDRDFEHYQDLDRAYQQRSSVWIETRGDWGRGTLELIEWPSRTEDYDNIGVFWLPHNAEDQPATGDPGQVSLPAGAELHYVYCVHWMGAQPLHPMAAVTGTRSASIPGGRQFMVDFAGPPLEPRGTWDEVHVVATAERGQVTKAWVRRNPFNGSWRATIDVAPEGREAVELRAYLTYEGKPISEVWSFAWNP